MIDEFRINSNNNTLETFFINDNNRLLKSAELVIEFSLPKYERVCMDPTDSNSKLYKSDWISDQLFEQELKSTDIRNIILN